MITLHHLAFSRSTRVLWLLEELKLDYNLVTYDRAIGGPAPASLKAVHPLGKSPTIVDGDLVLTESSAILRYIDRLYGNGRFSPNTVMALARHDEWLDFVEGSAGLPVMMTLIGGRGGLPAAMADFVRRDAAQTFGHIDEAVRNQAFLLGDQITLADMQMSYMLEIAGQAGSFTGSSGHDRLPQPPQGATWLTPSYRTRRSDVVRRTSFTAIAPLIVCLRFSSCNLSGY